VKKYLASYEDETTLNWYNWLPAVMLAYITSYHSTITTTPFELLFGVKPRLPAPDIKRHHCSESFAAEQLQLLQQAKAGKQQRCRDKNYKTNFDVKTADHKFQIIQKVWLSDTTSIGRNAKLSPNWISPFKIIDINDNNTRLKLKSNKLKVVNIA